MKLKGLVISLLAFFALAGSAQASTTIIEPVGSLFPYQRWIDESLVPTPEVTIEVVPTAIGDGCPGGETNYAACTSPELGKIWFDEAAFALFPANGDLRMVRWVFMHEMGHNFDFDGDLPEWARGWFMQLYGLVGPWRVITDPQPIDVPDELFADVYAGCSFEPYVTKQRMAETSGSPIAKTEPIFGFRTTYNKVCRMLRNL